MNTMTVLELRDRLIEDGLASVNEHETKPERIRGGIAGFEICRRLQSPGDFTMLLQERHAHEIDMLDDTEPEAYWEYRYATLQIEYVWERLKAAWGIGNTFSTRAILHVNRLYNERV